MRMVGFRNIAVHDYRKLDLDIVRSIVETDLGVFRAWVARAIAVSQGARPS
jgi:uncharacterized protein YutE (UPF0331/DUF86 family)